MENTVGNNLFRRRRILLAICGFLLAIIVPFSTAVIAAETVLFQPAPLLEALEKNNFYRDYPMLMLAFSSAGGDILSPGLSTWLANNMDQNSIEDALGFIFPETWVRNETQQAIKEIYAYSNFNTRSLDLGLDIVPVKKHLTGGSGRALIEQTLNSWPACTIEDALKAGSLLLQGQTTDLPRCKPPDKLIPVYLNVLQGGMNSLAAGLPDRLQLVPAQTAPAGGVYAVLRWGLRISPLAFLPVLLASLALHRWSIRAMLLWIGLPLYIGGLLAVFFAALAGGFAAWVLPLLVPTLPPPIAVLAGFALGVFLVVWREFLITWAIISTSIAVIGLFIFLFSNYLTRKQKGIR